MAVAVPVAALPLAYAATHESDHDVLRALLDLPVTLHDPLTEANAPELGRILANAADPAALTSDAPGMDKLPVVCSSGWCAVNSTLPTSARVQTSVLPSSRRAQSLRG